MKGNEMETTLLIPANIHRMMTGAAKAEIDGNSVRLTYTDGSQETALLGSEDIQRGRDNWFALVSSVQSKRSKMEEE